MRKVITGVAAVGAALMLAACSSQADTVSHNISKDAEDFKVLRKIIFYDGISGEYMSTMEGYCSIEVDGLDDQLEVTCKRGPDEYTKDFLGLSDNVSYMALQLEASDVDPYHYKVYLRPETVVPDIEHGTK